MILLLSSLWQYKYCYTSIQFNNFLYLKAPSTTLKSNKGVAALAVIAALAGLSIVTIKTSQEEKIMILGNVRIVAPSMVLLVILLGSLCNMVHCFTHPTRSYIGGRRSGATRRHNEDSSSLADKYQGSTKLYMAKPKKKKRKRKKTSSSSPPPSTTESSVLTTPKSQSPQPLVIPEDDIKAMKELSQSGDKPSLDDIKAIASFQPSSGGTIGSDSSDVAGENLIELPDIRNALQSKELKKMEEEEAQKKQRKKISRKDTKAFLELLEAEPFADADDSYFEDEEYGTVSALLAEGAKPFLGIPPGPLQVGHFIGSLGIILCAFIDYPGFPLTNLPTPLRDALQGGLGVIYLINTVLAIGAVFKATERGQPAGLWAMKTFSIGGLAFDQLTQLPTLKQVEEMENRKGARALKKNKRR